MQYLKKRNVTNLLILMAVLLWSAPMVIGQTLNVRLAQKVEAFDSERSSTLEQLIELARRFQIPMGIEWLDAPGNGVVPAIHMRKATLQDILRQILRQQPGYDLRLSNDVVHIFASSLTNDGRDFLNLRLPEFRVEKESLFGASYQLKMSLKRLLHPSMGYGGGYGHGIPRSDEFDVPKITFSGNNLTVRQILNNIVAMQGNALWVVRLRPWQMMTEEPFYAQTLSTTTKKAASDFHWEFITLREFSR